MKRKILLLIFGVTVIIGLTMCNGKEVGDDKHIYTVIEPPFTAEELAELVGE